MTKEEFIDKIDELIDEYIASSNKEYEDIEKGYTILSIDEFLIGYSIYRQNR